MIAAIYAHSALGRGWSTSIDRQIATCRESIESKGWTVSEDYIRSDSGAPEFVDSSREGLQSLVAAAILRPCPFGCIVVDHKFRLGRGSKKSRSVIETFRALGVPFYFSSTHLDTRTPRSRISMVGMDLLDEEYLSKLAATIDRGEKRKVRQGIIPGGPCYGYNKIPIENDCRKDECMRQADTNHRTEINKLEADVVRHTFRLFGSGAYTLVGLARELSRLGIDPPKSRRGNFNTVWTTKGLSSLLTNERYRGLILRDRAVTVLHPGTKKKGVIYRPKPEWAAEKNEDLRIVSDEQWQKVQLEIQRSMDPNSRRAPSHYWRTKRNF